MYNICTRTSGAECVRPCIQHMNHTATRNMKHVYNCVRSHGGTNVCTRIMQVVLDTKCHVSCLGALPATKLCKVIFVNVPVFVQKYY